MNAIVQPSDAADKVAAIIASDAAKQPDMGNMLAEREAAMLELIGLGTKAANGAGSLLEVAYLVSDKGAERLFHFGTGKSAGGDDAEKAYLAYAMAHNAANVSGVEPLPVDPKDDAKHSISILRTYGLASHLTHGADFYRKHAMPVFRAIDKEVRYGSAYNTMVRINRALVKDGLDAVSSPIVTDEWIGDLCRKEDKGEKSGLDKLKPAVDAIMRAYKSGLFEGIDTAALALDVWYARAIAEQAAAAEAEGKAETQH